MIPKLVETCSQANVDKALARLKKLPKGVVNFVYENAKVNSQGPLRGVPIVLKDNFATIDAPTTASSKILLGFRPFYDATVVEQLRAAGATIIGKAALDELGLGGTGLYSCFGEIYNPINSQYQVGGSSSGSAYAMHYPEIPVAIATDTGDSVRRPASYVGIVGYKPTYGSVSRYGLNAYATSLDTPSWMTKNVYDSAIMSSVLIKEDHKDFASIAVAFELEKVMLKKPKKVGYFFDEKFFDSTIGNTLSEFLKNLEKTGVQTERIKLDYKFLKALLPTYKIISFAEATSNLSNLTGIVFGNRKPGEDYQEIIINSRSQGFNYMVQRRIVLGNIFLKKENQKKIFVKALKVRRVLVNIWEQLCNDYDVVIYPSQTNKTPSIHEGVNSGISQQNGYNDLFLFANFLGSPSMSLPFGKIDDMPFGLAINTGFGQDEALHAYALFIEKIIGINHA